MSHVTDQVFVLRFWREQLGIGKETRWCAQVRDVNTKQRHVVDDPESALNFVLSRLKSVKESES
jgi:hypothetical protein